MAVSSHSTVIGLTGGSGSGKTHIVREIEKKFSEGDLCVVAMDNYYRPRNEQPLDDSGTINFDTLEALDYGKLVRDLKDLLAGKTLRQEIYTFNNPGNKKLWLELKPAKIILIEGLYALCHSELREMTELIVFVEARKDQMLRRRIRRDNLERGYDLEDVVYRFERHVMPAYYQYVLPLREQAHLIIDNSKGPLDQVDRLYHWIRQKLEQ